MLTFIAVSEYRIESKGIQSIHRNYTIIYGFTKAVNTYCITIYKKSTLQKFKILNIKKLQLQKSRVWNLEPLRRRSLGRRLGRHHDTKKAEVVFVLTAGFPETTTKPNVLRKKEEKKTELDGLKRSYKLCWFVRDRGTPPRGSVWRRRPAELVVCEENETR